MANETVRGRSLTFAALLGAALTDLRQRAGQLFNKLLEAGWGQERHVSLDERWVLLTPHLRRLLRLLRELAANEVSDLKDFAATLRSICATLLVEGALDPSRINPEERATFSFNL